MKTTISNVFNYQGRFLINEKSCGVGYYSYIKFTGVKVKISFRRGRENIAACQCFKKMYTGGGSAKWRRGREGDGGGTAEKLLWRRTCWCQGRRALVNDLSSEDLSSEWTSSGIPAAVWGVCWGGREEGDGKLAAGKCRETGQDARLGWDHLAPRT